MATKISDHQFNADRHALLTCGCALSSSLKGEAELLNRQVATNGPSLFAAVDPAKARLCEKTLSAVQQIIHVVAASGEANVDSPSSSTLATS